MLTWLTIGCMVAKVIGILAVTFNWYSGWALCHCHAKLVILHDAELSQACLANHSLGVYSSYMLLSPHILPTKPTPPATA